jgi:hypothetical protein
MEVHHHPKVEKKGFKEYLLEGLMIFLAVMMGFFAESLREHINEHSRAEEFAETMVNDLSVDTASLTGYITNTGYAVHNVDTLMQLLSVSNPKDIPSGKLYWYGLFGGWPNTFLPNDATSIEMKSSGSLRFFTTLVNGELAKYDQLLQKFRYMELSQQGIYTEARKARSQLFEYKYNEMANTIVVANRKQFEYARIDSFIRSNPTLLSTDKNLFNQYVEMVRSRFMSNQVALADSLKEQAIRLIDALNKAYHLKEQG